MEMALVEMSVGSTEQGEIQQADNDNISLYCVYHNARMASNATLHIKISS